MNPVKTLIPYFFKLQLYRIHSSHVIRCIHLSHVCYVSQSTSFDKKLHGATSRRPSHRENLKCRPQSVFPLGALFHLGQRQIFQFNSRRILTFLCHSQRSEVSWWSNYHNCYAMWIFPNLFQYFLLFFSVFTAVP